MNTLLATSAPLMLASLGALISDVGGSLAVFIEGFMILGSFFSWTIASATGSTLLGIGISSVMLASIGWLLARFTHRTGANPFIVGIALNLLAVGLSDTLSVLWFGTKGVLSDPSVYTPFIIKLPLVDELPFLGALLSGHGPFVYIALMVALILAFIIHRSTLGLRLRASGTAPELSIERGINPQRYTEGAWAVAAFLAALAGAALSLRIGAYAPGGIAGRGWIALAAVYLGFRNVWGVVAASMIFAGGERIASAVQGTALISPTILLGFPSILALVFFSISQALKEAGKRR